jgi:hypothetical protein
MLYGIAVIAMMAACIIHLVKTGRNTLWLSAIIFLPVAGCIAYFVVEVLPGMQGNKHVRTARAKAVKAIDPQREVRAARDALDLADTAANRLRLADALAGLGRHGEAIALYREAIERSAGVIDARTEMKLADALYQNGQSEEALAQIDAMAPLAGQSERDRQQLLRAKIFEHLDRKTEALAIYEDVVTRMPGEEARCRYAALLLDQGWSGKAQKVLEEVESRMKRLDSYQRAQEANMYRWATETLAKLRR